MNCLPLFVFQAWVPADKSSNNNNQPYINGSDDATEQPVQQAVLYDGGDVSHVVRVSFLWHIDWDCKNQQKESYFFTFSLVIGSLSTPVDLRTYVLKLKDHQDMRLK